MEFEYKPRRKLFKGRPKQKVLEVLSLNCLDRAPRPREPRNRWQVEVLVEERGPVYAHPPRVRKRITVVLAPDELAAYLKVLTEGV